MSNHLLSCCLWAHTLDSFSIILVAFQETAEIFAWVSFATLLRVFYKHFPYQA